MKSKTASKPVSVSELLFICVVTLPCAALAALYGFALRASIVLGHWPQPYRPDPKSLGFTLHHDWSTQGSVDSSGIVAVREGHADVHEGGSETGP